VDYLLSRQQEDGRWPLDEEIHRPPADFGRAGESNKWITLDACAFLRMASKSCYMKQQRGSAENISVVAEPPSRYQLRLPFDEPFTVSAPTEPLDVEGTLSHLLKHDLTFEGESTAYATHNIHTFAAKFPPQLPRLFINELARPGELVLDPMVGSGTTVVEAMLAGRTGIGIDLDPLASLMARVKSTPLDLPQCAYVGTRVLQQARSSLCPVTDDELRCIYSRKAIEFFHYWFEDHSIAELYALVRAMEAIEDTDIRSFLQVVFSSVIITKSGGVTRARDLAHSRPHRDLSRKVEHNALDLFRERLTAAIKSLESIVDAPGYAWTVRADARCLPLADGSVHLVVTSPPYAANAIDYMRAHKFSLMWLGHEPKILTDLRRRYIGAELQSPTLELSSETANRIIQTLIRKDERRAAVVAYYFRDMESALREMLRVTAEGRAVILVVGSSTIQGVGIKAPAVIAELAASAGFSLVGVAKREILRSARMMPTSHNSSRKGIEARMHEEGVIGLIKPEQGGSHADT